MIEIACCVDFMYSSDEWEKDSCLGSVISNLNIGHLVL